LAFTGKIYYRILGLGLGLGLYTSGLVNIPAQRLQCFFLKESITLS